MSRVSRGGAQGGERAETREPWTIGSKRGDIALIVGLGMLVLLGFALAGWQRTGGQLGAPLDDVYIHYQYARNLATGHGFAFNPDQPTSGSTSPLWVLLLAGLHWVTGTLPLARLLSAAAYLGLGVVTYVLARQLLSDRRAALLAGVLTMLSGRLAWAGMSGMETTLFALLALLGILRHDAEQRRGLPALGSAALFGLASLLRPEGYLLYALATLDRWLGRWQGRAEGVSWRRWLALEAGAIALYVALIAPYLVFSHGWTGHLLPNTFRVVSGDVRYGPLRYGREFVELVILDHPVLAMLLPIGLVVLGRRCLRSRPLFLAWMVGLPLVSAWVAPRLRHHGRYVMPLIPLYVLTGVAGLSAVLGWWQRRVSHRALARAGEMGVILVVVGVALWRSATWADQYAWNVDNINEMQVALGRWVAENTPPEAVVAANDIGAIGYVSGREVIDTVGLVTPEVIGVLSPWEWAWKRDAALTRYLSYRDPALVIVFPNWYRALTQDEQVLAPVHAVELTNNTICGGPEMIAYAPRWPYVRDPEIAHRVDAGLGREIRLLGYDLSAERAAPGAQMRLTLYWESVQPTDAHWRVFVHLADEQERIWGQDDAYPAAMMAPTFLWQPGDVVRDEHVFALAPDAPRGTYRLVAGMYDEATMERLPVVRGPDAGAGRVLLTELDVGG